MRKTIRKLIWHFYKPLKKKIIFKREFKAYNLLAGENKALKKNIYPCLFDSTIQTEIEPIYFLQDAWAFERIFKMKPEKHIDIGSGHKFVSLLSKITCLTMVDIRPFSVILDSINFLKGDILNLPFENESIYSLSSLCVIEHIGLGRYGDKLNPDGSEMAFHEINRVLKPGADFYFSVPIEDKNTIYFNAHRSFNESYIFNGLLSNFRILDKKYIYDHSLVDEINPLKFGIGCYHIRKKN